LVGVITALIPSQTWRNSKIKANLYYLTPAHVLFNMFRRYQVLRGLEA
jgi:hypothetical protein